MNLLVAIIALMAIGALHDVLWTLYIRAVSLSQRTKASLLSGVLTMFGFVAWTLMIQTGAEGTAAGIVAYGVGGAFGTYMSFGAKLSEQSSHEPTPIRVCVNCDPSDAQPLKTAPSRSHD